MMDGVAMVAASERELREACDAAMAERDRIGLDEVVRKARGGDTGMRDLLVRSFIKYGLKAARKRCGDLYLDYVSWTVESVDDAIRDYDGSSPFMSYLMIKFRNRMNKGFYAESLVHVPENKIRDGVRLGYDGLTGEDGEALYVSGSRSDATAELDGVRRTADAICGGSRRDAQWLSGVVFGDGAVRAPRGKRAVAVARMRGVYKELKSRGMI